MLMESYFYADVVEDETIIDKEDAFATIDRAEENPSLVMLDAINLFRKNIWNHPLLSQSEEQGLFTDMATALCHQVIILSSYRDSAEQLGILIQWSIAPGIRKPGWMDTVEYYSLRREIKQLLEIPGQIYLLKKLKHQLGLLLESHSPAINTDNVDIHSTIRKIEWPATLVNTMSRRCIEPADQSTSLLLSLHQLSNHSAVHSALTMPDAIAIERAEQLTQASNAYFKARNNVLIHNLRLVHSIANKYANQNVPLLDVIQEGFIGLVRAAEKYRTIMGFRFSTYAYNWIDSKARLVKEQSNGFMRLPTHIDSELASLRKVIAQLNYAGEKITEDKLAASLSMSNAHITELLAIKNRSISIDQAISSDNEQFTLGAMLEDKQASTLQETAQQELAEILIEIIKQLPKRESYILIHRYGLMGGEELSLEMISKNIGLSRERIRQLEIKAIKTLREKLRGNRMGNDLIASMQA